MPFCSQCGAKKDEGARFCEDCGKVLADTKGQALLSGSGAVNLFQKLSLGKKISLSGSVLAFVCFFLPWVKVWFMTLSGFNLIEDGTFKGNECPWYAYSYFSSVMCFLNHQDNL